MTTLLSPHDASIESPPSAPREQDVRVRVENLGKIFCQDLKRSLWYGAKDSLKDLIPGRTSGRSPGKDGTIPLRKGEFWANQNISFELRKGECLGLIGHNGAGKTTLLKMLTGLIKPDVGRIEMRGRVGALIALGAGFNPILTGRENIYVNGSILGLSRREIDEKIDEIIEFSEIREFIDSPVQNYSSGMSVRLGFAIASALNPDILLLDEVLAVGDVSFQAKCFNMLASLRKQGTPFILVSHNMHQIARYCDKVLYLSHGKVQYLGESTKGIELFLNDMEGAPREVAKHGAEGTVSTGSGKIRVLNTSFHDLSGHAIAELPAGSPLTVCITYQVNAPDVTNPSIDFVIREDDDQLFQITKTLPKSVQGSTKTLSIHFPSLPFNCSSLLFFFCLFDAETREIYDWKRNIELSIRKNPSHHSKAVLETTWTVATLEA